MLGTAGNGEVSLTWAGDVDVPAVEGQRSGDTASAVTVSPRVRTGRVEPVRGRV